MLRKFGALVSPMDERDFTFGAHHPEGSTPAAEPELRGFYLEPFSQGRASSCVGAALARALHVALLADGHPTTPYPSVLWLYAMARRLAFSGVERNAWPALVDGGTYVRHALLALQRSGWAPATAWPYSDLESTLDAPAPCYHVAANARGTRFYRIDGDRLDGVRRALASRMPVIRAGYVSHPDTRHEGPEPLRPVPPSEVTGGHATTILAMDPDGTCHEDWNWGADFGDNGLVPVAPERISGATTYELWALSAPAVPT